MCSPILRKQRLSSQTLEGRRSFAAEGPCLSLHETDPSIFYACSTWALTPQPLRKQKQMISAQDLGILFSQRSLTGFLEGP